MIKYDSLVYEGMKPGTQTAKAPRKTMEPVAIATGYPFFTLPTR
jgi:hypothetical protein